MTMYDKFLPYIIMLLPPLFWAGNFVVGRAVLDNATPIGLAFSRWLLALVFLLPFILKPLWQQRDVIKKYFWELSLLAILSVAGFNTFAYIALQYTTATNATLLNSFIPIFILIISGLFFQESISSKQIIGVFVSLLGVVVILARLDQAVIAQLSVNKGDLWMLVAALSWALYSLLLKYLRPKDLSAAPFLGILIIIGTIVLLPVLWIDPFNEPAIVWNN